MNFTRPLSVLALSGAFVVAALPARAQQVYSAPPEVLAQIREEGTKRSQIMATASYLTDVIGGRLTGSPSGERASQWTRDQMAKWGLQNAHLETWGPFGRGWILDDSNVLLRSPGAAPLIGLPKAWTPATPGPVTGDVVLWDNDRKDNYTRYKGKLRGKIVLISAPRALKPDFDATAKRREDTDLLELANSPLALPRGGGGGGGRTARTPLTPEDEQKAVERAIRNLRESGEKWRFWKSEGVAVAIDNSFNGSGGTVFVAQASVPQPVPADAEALARQTRLQPYDPAASAQMVPQMTLATEDYNRLTRLINLGQPVRLTVNIKSRYLQDDAPVANTIAEIPGTDLSDEVVMIGAHLDSWHGSTGATDNAAGCAVAMEAARIIQSLGLKPRRTIRVALWTGEEEGLLGSRAYVTQHFGENKGGELSKGADYEKLSAYYNLDNGTGKIRGVFAQGNEAVAPIFRTWLAPFADLQANTLTLRSTGSTDHISFDRIGLPGFQFIQDDIDYFSRTHHSNEDNFDRLQADDLQQAAVIMAAFAYQTAMMDERLPRKPLAQ